MLFNREELKKIKRNYGKFHKGSGNKHSEDKHNRAFVQFEMKIVKQHFSAFSRLIHESVRIDRNSRDKSISILNSKLEWGSNKLPRLVIEKDESVESGKRNDYD